MNNNEYINIINDIIENEMFCKLKKENHHYNSNRFNHCVDVSYKTYKITKRLKLDYKSATRAALLHDFFFENDFKSKKQSIFKHSYKAVINASSIVKLNSKEKSIIKSHMFPIGGHIPTNIESIIVNIIDDCVSIYERFGIDFKYIKTGLSFISTLLFAIIL